MEIIISKTGKINGRGSDKFKWVSGLTLAEREAAKNGEIVLIPDYNRHPACTEYKRVFFGYGRFYHRNYYGQINHGEVNND